MDWEPSVSHIRQAVRRTIDDLGGRRRVAVSFAILLLSALTFWWVPGLWWLSATVFILTLLSLGTSVATRRGEFTRVLEVRKAQSRDLYRGWVRINKSDRGGLSRHRVCRISTANGVTRRAVLGIDPDEGIIVTDLDTRNELGVTDNRRYEFVIQPLSWWQPFEWHLYLWRHPDTGVRTGYRFGVIGFFLGSVAAPRLNKLLVWLLSNVMALAESAYSYFGISIVK